MLSVFIYLLFTWVKDEASAKRIDLNGIDLEIYWNLFDKIQSEIWVKFLFLKTNFRD